MYPDLDNLPVIPCERITRRWWIVPLCLLVILGVMCAATYRKSQETRARVERSAK